MQGDIFEVDLIDAAVRLRYRWVALYAEQHRVALVIAAGTRRRVFRTEQLLIAEVEDVAHGAVWVSIVARKRAVLSRRWALITPVTHAELELGRILEEWLYARPWLTSTTRRSNAGSGITPLDDPRRRLP